MTDLPSGANLPARYADGRFGPGNPGRRPGARGRAAHRVTMAILDDFMAHREDVLQRVRGNPQLYLSHILKLLPIQVECAAPDVETWSDAEVDVALARARATLTNSYGRGALIELESVLLGERPAVSTHRNNGD